VLQAELASCNACPEMIGPVVHGPAIASRVFLLGQAPGPHEGDLGRPFAWTAGKTLFRWIEEATGATEEAVRAHVYFAAVARCFPGKAKGGGDRVPSPDEIERCERFVAGEIAILEPELVVPVGSLAIAQVFGEKLQLVDVVGKKSKRAFHGHEVDIIALPHPSGASTWHRMEPGKTLLGKALRLFAKHPAVVAELGPNRPMRTRAQIDP
jgi:uracil-DNA glycosylase